jgi:two-component system, NarL family, invasion response regulator UvrY
MADIRVMLVDDHAIVRSGFKRLLEQQAHVKVVAEAADAERAYTLYFEHLPDVVVMDISLRGVSGFESIRRIVDRDSDARIIVFSMHEDAAIAERAIALGARGYVTKSNEPDVLAAALNDVMSGKLALSPDIAKAIATNRLDGGVNTLDSLSAREFEIFRLWATGKNAHDIAKLLNLSSKTVANYHTLVKQKLQLNTDVEWVLLAQRHHLL